VNVRWTAIWDDRVWHHIPSGNPKVTKLVGMALEAVRNGPVDVIWSYYLEPYAFAASIVSAWTGVPFVLRHAGSDRFRLMRHPNMTSCYREVFARANILQSVDADYMGLGVPEDRMVRSPRRLYIPQAFSPKAPAMDIPGTLTELRQLGWHLLANDADPDMGKPIVGMYGKAGSSKGIVDVLKAVSSERSLRDVQVFLMSGGIGLPAVRDCIRRLRIQDRVWLLPFLPHWQVPTFIRSCNVVCALEHGFAIPQHTPSLPREVMACGTPIVLSNELAAKNSRSAEASRPGTFACDPQNVTELAGALSYALQNGKEESLADMESFQETLARERDAIADDCEKAISKAVAAGGPKRTRTRIAREPSAAIRREWLSSQVPTIWKYRSDELAMACSEVIDLNEFLANAVTQSLAFAFNESSGRLSQSECAIEQLEAALLWMHSDCEGARGVSAFNYPEGALPLDISMNNKLTYVPASNEICPLASSLVLFMKPDRYAAEMLHDRMREIAIARAGSPLTLTVRARKNMWWMFAKAPSLEGTIYSVGSKVKQLLEACDGRTPSGQIERSVFGPDQDPQAFAGIWHSLVSKGLVEFVWYP
jgi:glycosyltransferase involved in cell wall biosynthesis